MGPTAAVFTGTKDLDQLLATVEVYLASLTDHIERSRKGRVWDIWIDGRPFQINIDPISDVLRDCADDLLELGLLPDEMFHIEYPWTPSVIHSRTTRSCSACPTG